MGGMMGYGSYTVYTINTKFLKLEMVKSVERRFSDFAKLD